MKEELEIQRFLDAKMPLFFIMSSDESRVEELLKKLATNNSMKFHSWSLAAKEVEGTVTPFLSAKKEPGSDFFEELDYVVSEPEDTLILWKGMGRIIRNNDPEIMTIRRIKEFIINPEHYIPISKRLKYKPIFILDSNFNIPAELEKESVVIDFKLPGREEILSLLTDWESRMKKSSKIKFNDPIAIADNLRGLTDFEIRNTIAYLDASFCEDSKTDLLNIVKEQKRNIIKKTEFLDFISDEVSTEDVGGMDILKDWLKTRRLAYSKSAEEYGLPKPKGVLLVGLPGAGKSLIAKAVADLWKVPLIRWDVSKLFNSFIGQSEKNTRNVLKTIESIGNCVLWVDEIEKGLAGVHSSTYTDAGTTSRIFGVILTWLQENKSGSFLVATSNNIKQLPPELLRKGRFNEIFFVPLPSRAERAEIFSIHLKKRGRNPSKFNLDQLVEASNTYVGAEIEEAVITAMFNAFADNEREVTTEDIVKAVKNTVPLSKIMADQLKDLYSYVEEGKVKFASSKGDMDALDKKVGFN